VSALTPQQSVLCRFQAEGILKQHLPAARFHM